MSAPRQPGTSLRPYCVYGIMDRLQRGPCSAAYRNTPYNQSFVVKKMDSSDLSRRTFIKNTAAATAVAMAAPVALKAKATAAPSDSPNGKLRLGFIGVGGRAQQHLESAIKLHGDGTVEVVAVCDVFNRHREEAAEKIYEGT